MKQLFSIIIFSLIVSSCGGIHGTVGTAVREYKKVADKIELGSEEQPHNKIKAINTIEILMDLSRLACSLALLI